MSATVLRQQKREGVALEAASQAPKQYQPAWPVGATTQMTGARCPCHHFKPAPLTQNKKTQNTQQPAITKWN